jgi:hypothetical protein
MSFAAVPMSAFAVRVFTAGAVKVRHSTISACVQGREFRGLADTISWLISDTNPALT